jgi:hypothetical protein
LFSNELSKNDVAQAASSGLIATAKNSKWAAVFLHESTQAGSLRHKESE